MILDHNAPNRAILVTLGRHWGMKTVVFDCSPRAYGWMCTDATAAGVNVAPLDYHMPGMDGPEASRWILQMNLQYCPHIAALTANVIAEDRAACIAARMEDFLTKPLLMRVLRAFLDARVAVKMRSAHIADDVRGYYPARQASFTKP